MDHKSERRGLGRGLSALLADAGGAEGAPAPRPEARLPIDVLHPNPDQPRRRFGETELADLAASVRAKGVLQPLIVRPLAGRDGAYQIVAGERRWRAAQQAGLHELPVVIRELSDAEVLELAIIENVQRTDLNPLEEARGYQQLIERFGHSQEQVAQALGKSRSHIANLLRLLQLPEPVRELLAAGALSAGHARALVTLADPMTVARRIVDEGLSVREAEALAKRLKDRPAPAPAPRARPEKDADTRALEADLSAHLGLAVRIEHGASGEAGELRLRYRTLDELDGLCRLLSR